VTDIILYTSANCIYCDRAKDLLTKLGIVYNEYRVDIDRKQLNIMMERTGKRTIPQVFIGKYYVGGFDELYHLHQVGQLNLLLQREE